MTKKKKHPRHGSTLDSFFKGKAFSRNFAQPPSRK